MTAYQNDRSAFDRADAAVLGVSIDAQPAKTAWARSLGDVSFDLLSDFHPHGAVAEQYGVFRRKEGFSERAVFLIDKQGKIAWSKVYDIPEHPSNQDVLTARAKRYGRESEVEGRRLLRLQPSTNLAAGAFRPGTGLCAGVCSAGEAGCQPAGTGG